MPVLMFNCSHNDPSISIWYQRDKPIALGIRIIYAHFLIRHTQVADMVAVSATTLLIFLRIEGSQSNDSH